MVGTSAQLFQKRYFLEKANFSEKQNCALPTFSGSLLFQKGNFLKKTLPSIAPTFSEELFFHNTFSKEILLHRKGDYYISYLSVSN